MESKQIDEKQKPKPTNLKSFRNIKQNKNLWTLMDQFTSDLLSVWAIMAYYVVI